MTTNVGTADRVIRILAGLVLLSLVFLLESNARWWGLVGLLPLATGLAGWCALYRPWALLIFGVVAELNRDQYEQMRRDLE